MILSLVMLHLCKLTVKWDGSRIGGEGKRSIANSAGQGFFFYFQQVRYSLKNQLNNYTGKI